MKGRRCVGAPRWWPFALSLAAATACGVGDGSDIGPVRPDLPTESCRVVVLDEAGRGVVGATVAIRGTGIRGITGRNGRADLAASPRGRVVVEVDGSAGAAVAGDRLAAYSVAQTIVGQDLPAVLHVPNLPSSATTTVTAGTQTADVPLVTPGGAVVLFANGSSVGAPNGVASVEISVGELPAQRVPGDRPAASGGALLWSRAVLVAAPGASFTPGGSLAVPNDLGLTAGNPTLWRLAGDSGEWTEVAAATALQGGLLVAVAAITGPGLYAFTAPVAATEVRGRVVDADGDTLAAVLVGVDGLATTTDADGRFTVAAAPATAADGSARSLAIELVAGGSDLPVRATATATAVAGVTELGDLTLDTVPAGNLRLVQLLRGRVDGAQTARLSTSVGDVALATLSDDEGLALFEDVPARFFGFQTGRPIDAQQVVYGQSAGLLQPGRRWAESLQFMARKPWSRTYVSDALGGGPLVGAAVVQGATPGAGLIDLTGDGGTFFITRQFEGRGTASFRSSRDGRTIVHALSIVRPDGEHLEFPLQRVLRTPLGAFDRHGLVAGTLLGADLSRQHALRATRRLLLQEWWDDVVDGIPLPTALPIDVDPAVTHDRFVAGVDAVAGQLAAVELAAGSVRTLEKLALATDLRPTEGATITRDLDLTHVASETFVVAGVLADLDPAIDVAALQLDVGLQQAAGRVVDVVRGLAGNVTAGGVDLQLRLPPLQGALGGQQWLALVRGSGSTGGVTSSHASLYRLPLAATPRQLPRLPTIEAPAAASTVAAAGFRCEFTLPAGAVYGLVELRSEQGSETLLWQAFVPPGTTAFDFVTLPATAPTPLVAGRSYTLTVTAGFGSGGITGTVTAYVALTAFLQSIGVVDCGITQVARRSIQVTTN
jgi:hypothetical protein